MIEPPPLDAALRGLNLSFMPTTAEHLSEAVEKAIREAQGDDAVLAVEGHARVVREYMESVKCAKDKRYFEQMAEKFIRSHSHFEHARDLVAAIKHRERAE